MWNLFHQQRFLKQFIYCGNHTNIIYPDLFVQYCENWFLLSSDIRSEGSIAIVKIFDFDFLMIFILHHSHSLKMCFRKMSVCVSVWTSPIVEPKPIDRSRSNSIYRVLMRISRAVFLIFPLPLKLRVGRKWKGWAGNNCKSALNSKLNKIGRMV